MPDYRAPLRDIQFLLHDVLTLDSVCQRLPGYEEVNRELVDAIVDEGARFCEEVLAPLYQTGDQGCHWDNGVVTTPAGFREAYQQFVANGWPALAAPVEHGGQGMPNLLECVMNELVGSANWAWGMYPGLSHGAVRTIEAHGTDDQKQRFLQPLIRGEWTGTMCLTEPHCGSDLGLLRTRAQPLGDGRYAITGTKIFISAGEHDLADNIVHIVLARLPDAPAGTKGISLFIVPKYVVDTQGQLGARNAVQCGSIEHKMGIHGSATCVLNFDGAEGFLLGEPHHGLNCMFTFMNLARLGTAVQGVAHAERAYQGALAYARERLQMRSLSGVKKPDAEADPIIVHPDVRRMLLTQKAIAEGGRAFVYYLGQLSDIAERSADTAEAERAESLMAFLTPIAKAFLTEMGVEAASHGMQVLGGHGYIREWGMEQILRDARISTIYEGTTGIQSLDLLGRKMLGSGGQLLLNFTEEVKAFCQQPVDDERLAAWLATLQAQVQEWEELSLSIGGRAMKNPDEVGAASVDYLFYSGYVTLAYFFARMAKAAIAQADEASAFHHAKLETCAFYFARLLPRAQGHRLAIAAGAAPLMSMTDERFLIR